MIISEEKCTKVIIDYLSGYKTSVIVTICLTFVLTVTLIVIHLLNRRLYWKIYLDDIIDDTEFKFILLIHFLWMPIFCAIYSIINFFYETDFHKLNYIMDQPYLGLRICSIMIFYQVNLNIFGYVKNSINHNIQKSIAELSMLNNNLIYSSICFILWISIILAEPFYITSILSWCLLFIISDWFMICNCWRNHGKLKLNILSIIKLCLCSIIFYFLGMIALLKFPFTAYKLHHDIYNEYYISLILLLPFFSWGVLFKYLSFDFMKNFQEN